MNSFSTDVVVVGSGSAGISACFELYQKHVPFVLLEKGNKVGGAGKFGAHGVFAINSTEQKERHVKRSEERRVGKECRSRLAP